MPIHSPESLATRGLQVEPIRLRTLVLLRWVALAGQLCAVVVAGLLGLRLDPGPVFLVLAASAAFNLVVPGRHRLGGGRSAAVQLAFDIVQVSVLLTMTGGLSNPFAMLILAPVTVAATALGRRTIVLLGLATIGMITVAALFARPLTEADGAPLEMPFMLLVGHWVAIVVAVGFFATYAHRVAAELRARSDALAATEMALAREQKLQHLGGVVAAAAHEMGTPLATIKLVASELSDELSDRAELAADLQLLRDSADRCRDILRSMGRAGKDDVLLRSTPLTALVAEAAEPHRSRGNISVECHPGGDGDTEPNVRRDAAIVHGVRNLIQNAVDFSRHRVRVDVSWTPSTIAISVSDDGPGFAPAVLSRIGEPFLTSRRPSGEGNGDQERSAYEGMGLGLFIAKTLLERSGATLVFQNQTRGTRVDGARVDVTWPRQRIEVSSRAPLGENPAIA